MAKTPSKISTTPSSVKAPFVAPIPAPEPAPIVPAEPAEPVAAPVAEAAEPVQTAEIIQAQTRYGFPVYVPTQKKLIAPNDVVPLILDSWVRNQLEQERGALVRAKL